MELILLFFVSLIASFIFALGGVGAAIVLIPLLVSFFGVPLNIAKPVGLFYNTVSLAGASVHNFKNKRLDIKIGIPIIISSFIFAAIGAYLSKFIPTRIILYIFIAFLLFSSYKFISHRKKDGEKHREDAPFLKLSLIGMIAGLLSGLLGVGGGGIISPLMLMMGYSPKKITTITAFVVPFSSFSGFITYWSMGDVRWKVLIVAASGGILGATLGTHVMHKHLDQKTVRIILGIILLLLAIKMTLKAI